jgi:hypothetical protein
MAAGAASATFWSETSPASLTRREATRPAVGCGGNTWSFSSASSSSSSSSGAGLPRSESVAPSQATAKPKRRRLNTGDIDAAAVVVKGTATSTSLSSSYDNAVSLPARVAFAQAAAWPGIPRKGQANSAACAPTEPGRALYAPGLAAASGPAGLKFTALIGGRSLQGLMEGVDRDLPMPARGNSDADAYAGGQSAGAGMSSARAGGAEPRAAPGVGAINSPVAQRTQHTTVGPRCLEHRCSGAAQATSATMADAAARYGLRQPYSAGPIHALNAASCPLSSTTEELASLVRGGTAHVEAVVRSGAQLGVSGAYSVSAAGTTQQLFDFGMPDNAAAPSPPAAVLDVLLTLPELCSELIATALAAGEATPQELLNGMVPADLDAEAQQEWMVQLYAHIEAGALPQRDPEADHIAADRLFRGPWSAESGGGTRRTQLAQMGAARAAHVSARSRVRAGRSVEEQGSCVSRAHDLADRRASEFRRHRAPEQPPNALGLTHAYWEAQLPVGSAILLPQATTGAPPRQPLVRAAPRPFGLGGLGIAECDSVLREL